MERHEDLISFLGWFALTYAWLSVNLTFAGAIQQAIANHNDAIRQETFQELEDEENSDDSEKETENTKYTPSCPTTSS